MKQEYVDLISFGKELQILAQKYDQLCQKIVKEPAKESVPVKIKIEKKIPDVTKPKEIKKDQPAPQTKRCKIPDCKEPHHAKGFCNRHYKQDKKGQKIEQVITPEEEPKETIKVEEGSGMSMIQASEKDFSIPDEIMEKIDKIEEVDNIKQKTKTILEQKEEELTDLQRKDLEEHKAALIRLEEMKNRPREHVKFDVLGKKA